MDRVLLLIIITVAPSVRAAGFSRNEKNRIKLKALLYDYTHSRSQSGKSFRQCGPGTDNVCCTPSQGITEDDCEFNTKEMFENAKRALMFKIYQIENFDARFKRLNRSVKLVDGKRSKFDNFDNTTQHLLRALGGDKANPKCTPQGSAAKTTLRNAVITLDRLGNCSAVINQTCQVNETDLGINIPDFNQCVKKFDDIMSKIDVALEENDETAKCLLWREAAEEVEKVKKFPVLNKTCTAAMKEASQATAQSNEKGLKGRCLLKFIECKQAEDEAISLINACGDERTVILGNFRSLINEMEDEEEDKDYDDYDDFQWIHNFE